MTRFPPLRGRLLVLAAVALLAGQASMAQGNRNHETRDEQRTERRDDRRGEPSQRNERPDRGQRAERDPRPYVAPPRNYPPNNWQAPYQPWPPRLMPRNGYGYEPRGGGPNHSYYRGQRLPNQYRTYQYVVEDWRGHRLSAPPRGYHWVQAGGDYLLVAITTGVILQLLLNN